MKNYALFAGDVYYPCGGIWDFEGFFDTVNEAEARGRPYDWYQVVDTTTWKVVSCN